MRSGSRAADLLRAGERRFARLGGDGRVRAFSAILATAALALHLATGRGQDPLLASPVEWWAIAGMFGLAEVFVVHVQLRREHHSFSLSEVPLVLGLFFVPPAVLLPARLLSGFLALSLHRRQPLTKLLFNLSSFAAEVSVAVLIFDVMVAGVDPSSAATWPAAVAASLAAAGIGALNVTTGVALYEGVPPEKVGRTLVPVSVGALANSVLALIAVALVRFDPLWAGLVAALMAVLFVVYRSYASLLRRHQSLELLHTFTRHVGTTLDADISRLHLLRELRGVLKGEIAELVLDAGDGTRTRTRLGADDALTTITEPGGPLVDRPTRISRGAAERRRDLVGEGIEEALLAPLRVEAGVLGSVLVGNPVGGVIGFDDTDLRLFEATANHVSVALENSRLVSRLRTEATEKAHQALHDALTGLPNRRLFHARLGEALATREPSAAVAVLLIDLDRFKEVNDTLGHHNGDLLLQRVAERLVGAVRATDTVARLGGDEFAVLLPDVRGRDAAVATARAIVSLLSEPVEVSQMTLDVGASAGVALGPDDGDDASVLLQRADVAMYAAKLAGTDVEVYEAARDHYSPERLRLAGELRSAIETGQLRVHYQPKVELGSRRISGVEALIRWEHPTRGLLAPAEFIAIAEHTGLIGHVARFVLDEAVRQCAAWRADGHDLSVAVNLSMRDLLDPELTGVVADALARWRLPAPSLTVELTESVLMSDVIRTTAAVDQIARMGVGVSVDDFGIGYSSLSYLQELPVSEVKIDRSFVQHLGRPRREALVRSIVDLAGNLGLVAVAEGVADETTFERLAELGCDVAQGYWLGKPAPPDETGRLLVEGIHGMRPRPLETFSVDLV